MPRHFWDDLTFFHPTIPGFDIKLIGDHVPVLRKKRSPPQQQQAERDRIQLENINALYHNLHTSGAIPAPDAFVLFNPGIGHPFLKQRWQPTMEALLASRKPILLSSFSKVDLDRDVAVLRELCQSQKGDLKFLASPQSNPFRNLKYQIDPLDLLRPIRTNNFAMVVQMS
uniref:Mitochondrial splicing suppressor 51-like C-terminal domain-containing protein n=1 Tax=Globisporangium ultimum (strain ATCC 200006 / CBS 805.95 / DAOM BR144) TaxID=431595 RepID=K3WH95_GLOUD